MQVRNEEDRNKQITEAVMAILVCETESFCKESQKTYIMTKSKLNCLDFRWWTMATLNEPTVFQLDLIKSYTMASNNNSEIKRKGVDKETCQSKQQQQQEHMMTENNDRLVKDWLCLFETGSKTDLVIYARDEVAVHAHSLVIFTRCKRLFDNVIVENGQKQVISLPEVSKNVVTAFLKYL